MEVELDLPNYATKAYLKNTAAIDTSKFAQKVDLGGWKSEIDKLDIDKWETTSVDLSKLSDVVKNEVVKKTVNDEFVQKVNTIQITDNYQ